MPRASFVVLLLGLVVAALPASGTTYVAVSDEALIERAAVIGTFDVLSAELAPTARLATEYRVRVDTLLKGDLAGGTVLVRIPGGGSGSEGLRFSGLPSFRPGERVLLFLVPRRDGAWGIAHVLLGAFRGLERPEGDLLVRPHLAEARGVDRNGRPADTDDSLARDRAGFLAWIADRVAGRTRRADYWVPIDTGALAPRFTQFRDADDGFPLRWFQFDSGGSVVWHASSSGQTNYPDGGVAALRAGLETWTNLAQTSIDLRYGGTAPIDAGFGDPDGVNTVLFNDPHQEIDEAFDCLEGGVVAIGGPFYFTNTRRHNGQNWHEIAEGVVITNTNLACFLLSNTTRLAEVLGHELGHTLGLGHSCGDDHTPSCSNAALNDALMRATLHNDGRGPRLAADDMAAGRALYRAAGAGRLPRAPNNLTVQLVTDDATLRWTDRSSNEQGFRIYRRLGGGAFAAIGEAGAGSTTFLDSNLAAGSYDYEVRAFNADGESGSSNRVVVTVVVVEPGTARFAEGAFYGSEEDGTAVVKLERVGGTSGPLSVRLQTRDLSASAPFDYEARDLVVSWSNLDGLPKFVAVSIVDDFAAESSEVVELLLETVPAAGQQATALGTAAVAIADDDGSPGCADSDNRLCLLAGRFKVEVEWRNHRTGERGVGHALVGSDQSGYFWFFEADNIELIVKALDGRANNGAHWLFYGALSDVEYWVTVTDTATGERNLYRNSPGEICGIGDTKAFPQLAGASAPPAPTLERARSLSWLGSAPAALSPRAACVPNATTLCLLGGRFQVEVDWRNHRNGDTGLGTAAGFSDQTGFFWFFQNTNIELVVKAFDGQAANGKFWFFYGALSDVEYTIRVTDTVTGNVHTYDNEGGNICGQGDTSAFPGD